MGKVRSWLGATASTRVLGEAARCVPRDVGRAPAPMSSLSSEIPLTPPEQIEALLAGCIENLRAVYRGDEALFPYVTLIRNGNFVNDYRRPEALRYTVNTLLGLNRAARTEGLDISVAAVDEMVKTFTRLNASALKSIADMGLYTLLLAESGWSGAEDAARSTLERLATSLDGAKPHAFTIQDLAWVIWGAAAATRRGFSGADELGRSATALVKNHFVDPSSGLPRHSTKRYRRNVVSFGGLAYFLRAMHEAAHTFDDADAASLFSNGVRLAVSLQGPQGEWPWMIHVRTGQPFEVYPIFSVHQDSMAMLFLLPALDGGQPRTEGVIARSMAWGFGNNELGVQFYLDDPFFAYRSIERAERLPRLRRYIRFLSYSITRRPGAFGGGRHLRLNDQCRSYHLGWILFAWSDRLGSGSASSLNGT